MINRKMNRGYLIHGLSKNKHKESGRHNDFAVVTSAYTILNYNVLVFLFVEKILIGS